MRHALSCWNRCGGALNGEATNAISKYYSARASSQKLARATLTIGPLSGTTPPSPVHRIPPRPTLLCPPLVGAVVHGRLAPQEVTRAIRSREKVQANAANRLLCLDQCKGGRGDTLALAQTWLFSASRLRTCICCCLCSRCEITSLHHFPHCGNLNFVCVRRWNRVLQFF